MNGPQFQTEWKSHGQGGRPAMERRPAACVPQGSRRELIGFRGVEALSGWVGGRRLRLGEPGAEDGA